MSFQSFLSAVSCLADTRRKFSSCLYLDSSKLGCFPLGMKLFSTFFSRSSIVLAPRGNHGPLQVRLILNVCFCVLFSVSGILCQIGAKETKADGASTLRVMSFNIRLGVAKDGPNHWDSVGYRTVGYSCGDCPDSWKKLSILHHLDTSIRAIRNDNRNLFFI